MPARKIHKIGREIHRVYIIHNIQNLTLKTKKKTKGGQTTRVDRECRGGREGRALGDWRKEKKMHSRLRKRNRQNTNQTFEGGRRGSGSKKTKKGAGVEQGEGQGHISPQSSGNGKKKKPKKKKKKKKEEILGDSGGTIVSLPDVESLYEVRRGSQ